MTYPLILITHMDTISKLCETLQSSNWQQRQLAWYYFWSPVFVTL